jgi:hypothetical protein
VFGELVDRGAASGQRRGGGRDRGELLGGGKLGSGLGAFADHRSLVLRGAQDRLDQAAQRSAAVRDGERGGRHQRRHPLWRGPELTQPGAAAQAGAHVRAQDRELLGARLTVGERGQQRLVAGAVGAALDAGDARRNAWRPSVNNRLTFV